MAANASPSLKTASQETLERSMRDADQSHRVNAASSKEGEGESAIPEDKYEEKLEDEEDDWAHDARNPRNWPRGKKWRMTLIVSLYTFVSPLASSMMAPALPQIAEHFNITNPTLVAMTLSIFLLSFAIGPLILGPLSEMYGRTWIFHVSNLLFIAFNLGCAFAPTSGALIALRFFSGFAGCSGVAVGGGSVSDLFSERDRASAMAAYSIGPLIGPIIGPIAGGFVAQSIGFKYVFIIIAGLAAISAAIGIPLLRETYAPVIRLRIAAKSADPEAAASSHPHLQREHGSKAHIIWVNLSRPIVLLTRSFVCFMLSLYMALMYGCVFELLYYLMFSIFAELFEGVYGFSTGIAGLTYLGLGIGFMSATILGGKLSDMMYAWFCKRNGGKGKPEFRIPSLIFGSFFVPIGLFWFGWSAQARLHWIMPIIGTGIFGFGFMATFLPIQLYLVDAFTYAASALSAASLFRSLLGFAFPLFGSQMFAKLGAGGGNSLLAGLTIVFGIPGGFWLYFYGERIRAKSKYTQ